ncbi:MAG: DUF1854 domain-containing protein [Halanaerobiaceae bacterium]
MSSLVDEFEPLSPDQLEVCRDEYGDVKVKLSGEEYESIDVLRLFPYSVKKRYILLHDGEGKEVGIIEDLTSLDQKSREIIEQELEKKYFIPRITKIYDIQHINRTPIWHVQTPNGDVVFEMKRSRDAKFVRKNHVVIKDANRNKYEIPDIRKLDPESLKLLEKEI